MSELAEFEGLEAFFTDDVVSDVSNEPDFNDLSDEEISQTFKELCKTGAHELVLDFLFHHKKRGILPIEQGFIDSATEKHLYVAEALIKYFDYDNQKDFLIKNSIDNDNYNLLEFLLTHNCDSRNPQYMLWAVEKRAKKLINLIIKFGGTIDFNDDELLKNSIKNDEVDLFRFLLSKYKNPDIFAIMKTCIPSESVNLINFLFENYFSPEDSDWNIVELFLLTVVHNKINLFTFFSLKFNPVENPKIVTESFDLALVLNNQDFIKFLETEYFNITYGNSNFIANKVYDFILNNNIEKAKILLSKTEKLNNHGSIVCSLFNFAVNEEDVNYQLIDNLFNNDFSFVKFFEDSNFQEEMSKNAFFNHSSEDLIKIIEIFKKYNKTYNMNLPVLLGIANDNKEIFEYGLNNGAIVTENHNQALLIAYKTKKFDYLEKMLSTGINPEYLDNLLQLAVSDNNTALTKYLINKGVKIKKVSYEEQFQKEFGAVKPVTEKDFDMGLFSKKNVKEKEGIFLDRKTIFNNLMGTTLPYYIIVAFILYIVSLFVK